MDELIIDSMNETARREAAARLLKEIAAHDRIIAVTADGTIIGLDGCVLGRC
jgi:hypothetical protein